MRTKLAQWYFYRYFNIPKDKEIFRVGRNFIDYWEDKSIGLAKRRDYGQPLARIHPGAFLFCEPERGGTDTSSTNNADAMINSAAATTNYGSGTGAGSQFNVLNNTSNTKQRIVMDWTLSSGSGTISQISLFLYVSANSSASTVDLHELTQASAMVENQVTWTIWKTGSSWATPGGDYSATVVDTGIPPAVTNWQQWDLVGGGSDNPMSITWGSNFDIILRFADESGASTRYVTYYSKEDSGNDPYIEITYAGVNTEVDITCNLAFSTSIGRSLGFTRASTSNLSLSSTIARTLAFARASTSNLSLAASVVKGWGRTIATSCNLALSSTVGRLIGYTRATTSNLSLAPTIVRVRARTITTSVNLSLATTVSRAVTWARATTSSLSLGVSIVTNILNEYLETVTVNLALAVSVTKSWGRTISTSSNLSLAASVARIWAHGVVTSVSLSLATTVSRTLAYARATSSSLGLSAAISRTLAYARATTSNLTLAISLSRLVARIRSITARLSLAVSITKVSTAERVLKVILVAADSLKTTLVEADSLKTILAKTGIFKIINKEGD